MHVCPCYNLRVLCGAVWGNAPATAVHMPDFHSPLCGWPQLLRVSAAIRHVQHLVRSHGTTSAWHYQKRCSATASSASSRCSAHTPAERPVCAVLYMPSWWWISATQSTTQSSSTAQAGRQCMCTAWTANDCQRTLVYILVFFASIFFITLRAMHLQSVYACIVALAMVVEYAE
jgi:hypothetical protein